MAEETLSCASCGRPAAPEAMYCSGCGSALNPESSAQTKTLVASGETLSRCPNCGERMEPGAQFCSGCGEIRAASGSDSRSSAWDAVFAQLTRATKGEFEIVREVGRGAMGAVYLAKDVALSRKVAIKVISPQLLADENMVARFRLEARTVASLRNPHIVTIHAVRALDDLHYFIMDFVEGCSLRTVLKTHGSLPIDVIQALLFQVGGALAYAHRRGRGVIHRDIKPANIMIDVEGNAFVTDFGISKVAESSGLTLTGTGLIIGTPEYMSPEQCMGDPLTGAGDQYSLGVVAYEMLCGQAPFSGTQYSVLVAHGSRDPERIEDLRPDCPSPLREAVMRMMAKEPGDRWPSVDEAVAAVGGAPLGHADPLRASIVALIPGDAEGGAGLDTSSPLSPVAGASKSVSEVPMAAYVAKSPERAEPGVPLTPIPKIGKARTQKAARPRRWLRPAAGAASVLVLTVIVVALRDQLPLGLLSEQPAAQSAELPAVPDSPDLGSSAVANPPPAAVPLPVVASSISVVLETPLMREEDTQEIELRIVDADGGNISDFDGVSIRSSDPSVASLSDMRLTAIGPGSTYLVGAVDAVSDSVLVTVEALVASVDIEGGDLSLTVGSTIALTAEVRGSSQQLLDDRAVSWLSLSPGIAGVNPTTGQATAIAPGTAIIVARSEGVEDRVNATVALSVAESARTDDEPEPTPVVEAPAPLTEDRIALEVNQFISLLNDGNEDEVRALFGSAASATENEDLLEKMGRRDFAAELGGVGVPTTGDDQTTVPFQVMIRYRSGFGGGREETGNLVAIFILGPTGWQIEGYTVVSGAGF